MVTKKAGCYLINKETKQVALVYRDFHGDYTFPKGHLEPNETLKECAVRETAEETKRIAKVVDEIPALVETYTTPRGEECECHMFVAEDIGASDNDSDDTHPTIWIPFDDVEEKLSYPSLKNKWNEIKTTIKTYFGF